MENKKFHFPVGRKVKKFTFQSAGKWRMEDSTFQGSGRFRGSGRFLFSNSSFFSFLNWNSDLNDLFPFIDFLCVFLYQLIERTSNYLLNNFRSNFLVIFSSTRNFHFLISISHFVLFNEMQLGCYFKLNVSIFINFL